MPVTKQIAMRAKHGDEFYCVVAKNADGTPMCVRVNGACKTWKRYPEKFRLPVKRGLREHGYISELNGHEWAISEAAAIMEATPTKRALNMVSTFAHRMSPHEWREARRTGAITSWDGSAYWYDAQDREISSAFTTSQPGNAVGVAYYSK